MHRQNRTLAESQVAAGVWAEKLIRLDGSQFFGWLDRLRVFAKSLDERQVIKTGREFQMGAAITGRMNMHATKRGRFGSDCQCSQSTRFIREIIAIGKRY
jgi:hypothetical protein